MPDEKGSVTDISDGELTDIKSENLNKEQLVEAILFLENKPVNIKRIKDVSNINKREIPIIIDNINKKYDKMCSSLVVIQNESGDYYLTVKSELYNLLGKHYDTRRGLKLSQQAIETLAIIAYKQPITKTEIEQIRGVQVDYIIKQLLEYGLIRITGRKRVPGKPIIYGTTNKFLKYFGLLSLKDLPPIEEFDKL